MVARRGRTRDLVRALAECVEVDAYGAERYVRVQIARSLEKLGYVTRRVRGWCRPTDKGREMIVFLRSLDIAHIVPQLRRPPPAHRWRAVLRSAALAKAERVSENADASTGGRPIEVVCGSHSGVAPVANPAGVLLMDTSVSAAEALPFHPSRVDHERAALLLSRLGAKISPHLHLRPIDWMVLTYLAGQGPASYPHQTTIGEHLGLSQDTVHESLNRLRNRPTRKKSKTGGDPYGVALVWSEPIKLRTWLGDERTSTKNCRYWITTELVELLDRESDRRIRASQERHDTYARLRGKSAPIAQAPPAPASSPGRAELTWAEPAIQEIAHAFDALGLPTRDGRGRRPLAASEMAALRNRIYEGCSLEELREAVEGAAETVWERNGLAWAVDPFAVVFDRPESVRRWAALGRKRMKPKPSSGEGESASLTAPAPVSKTALAPSSPGSSESLTQISTCKTSTSSAAEEVPRALRAPERQARPHDATQTAASASAQTLPAKAPPSSREREASKEQEQNRGPQRVPIEAARALEQLFPGFEVYGAGAERPPPQGRLLDREFYAPRGRHGESNPATVGRPRR